MIQKSTTLASRHKSRSGIALIFALIILAVLATLGYSIATKLVSIKHRQNYIFDYYKATYACDSATRYGIREVENLKFSLQSRETMPDFSDIFATSEEAYELMLYDWARAVDDIRYDEYLKYEQRINRGDTYAQAQNPEDEESQFRLQMLKAIGYGIDSYFGIDFEGNFTPIDPNVLYVPGPYGHQFPYASQPMQIELGGAEVLITVEDENAKLPLVWAFMTDKDKQTEKKACFDTFFEWMGVDAATIEHLSRQFEDTAKIKPFEIGMEPATIETKEAVRTRTVTTDASGRRQSVFRTRYRTKKVPRSVAGNNTDFSRLIEANIDTERLAFSFYPDGFADSAPIKHLALWGSDKININTAPRNVLEAALVFGGREVDFADAVIIDRQIKPFEDIQDMKRRLYRFSDNIERVADLILFESEVFTIKVEAVSGTAKATSTTAILYKDNKFTKITTVYN